MPQRILGVPKYSFDTGGETANSVRFAFANDLHLRWRAIARHGASAWRGLCVCWKNCEPAVVIALSRRCYLFIRQP